MGGGYQVFDIGSDAPSIEFKEKAVEVEADVVGASALMNTTLSEQKEVEVGLSDLDVLTVYGGLPVDEEWVDEIGGDGYVPNYNLVVDVFEEILS